MKYAKSILLVISLLLSISSFSKDRIKGTWKHIDSTSHVNIDKKITVLVLNTNGKYSQYVIIIPKNSNTYVGIKQYEITGEWFISKNKIYLQEYGITNNIPLDYFYSNFENIQDLSSL
jgi:hypothetical protein